MWNGGNESADWIEMHLKASRLNWLSSLSLVQSTKKRNQKKCVTFKTLQRTKFWYFLFFRLKIVFVSRLFVSFNKDWIYSIPLPWKLQCIFWPRQWFDFIPRQTITITITYNPFLPIESLSRLSLCLSLLSCFFESHPHWKKGHPFSLRIL